ncbi:PhoH family protein [bacterium]|nr:PhoH family protein [bacterium]
MSKVSEPASRRVFVIDTNVFLHDRHTLKAFDGGTVCVPFAVLEELDSFKAEKSERGRNAREVTRELDALRLLGNLQDGVWLESKGTKTLCKILPPVNPASQEATRWIPADRVDNQILASLSMLRSDGCDAVLVTKDINARVRADTLGFIAEDYAKDVVQLDSHYRGWTKIDMPFKEIKNINEGSVANFLDDREISTNEFVLFQTEHDRGYKRIFRFCGNKVFRELDFYRNVWGFSGKNPQQIMALDLLLDDSVQLVSLVGPAGTGKTFLTLLSALFKVIKEREYRKLLVSRPVVALGADIGYLPGDVQEKILPWMKPVYDNLELILSKVTGVPVDSSEDGKSGSNAKRRPPWERKVASEAMGYSVPFQTEIERLQSKGIICLDSITYMRGRSIPRQFIFIDEVQNLTPHEVKTIVSRAGEGTKIVLAGDPYQIDSPYLDFSSNGLTVTTEKFKGSRVFGTVFLETSERSELAKLAVKLL